MPAETVITYLNRLSSLHGRSMGHDSMDPVRFRSVQEDLFMSLDDQYAIARKLLQLGEKNAALGKKLLYTLSRVGCADATFLILSQTLEQAKKRPKLLQDGRLAFARAHLVKLAEEGKNYRAKVLEGKIALRLGDEDRAIQLWTEAMATAIAEHEANVQGQNAAGPDNDANLQLSSPWIELMWIHFERSRRLEGKDDLASAIEGKKCEWAMEVGCQLDDPDAHYGRADWFSDRLEGTTSSTRLYHLTKAATSLHFKAAHELGDFYASSGWPFIEDEPPDRVKPTPFDRYPAPETRHSTWAKVRKFFGLETVTKLGPEDALFIAAAHPSTAQERFKLALEWLDVATYHGFAPSFLTKAKCHMAKTLWGASNAPKAALDLSDERYIYATEADMKANKPIEKESSPEPPDEPNPWYNIPMARFCLREVFYAYEAHKLVSDNRRRYESQVRKGLAKDVVDEQEFLSEGSFRGEVPVSVRKYLRFPEVRDHYEHDMESLIAEARAICDDNGWNMYDENNALLYQARSR